MKTTKTIKIKETDYLGVRDWIDDNKEYHTTMRIYSKKGKVRAELELTKDQLYILRKAINSSLFNIAKHDAGEDGYVITDDFMDRSDKG